MPTNTYDAIVLGDDLAGLVAAALCARRGLRVLVAETTATPPDKIPVGRWSLPRIALPFPGDASLAVRRVVGELNFIQTLRRRMTPLRPAFQIVLPDARIEVHADNDVLAREMTRELPDAGATMDAFLARTAEASKVLEAGYGHDAAFPPDGFWDRRALSLTEKRLATLDEDPFAPLPADHPVRILAALPAALTSASDPRALTPLAVARTFDLLRRGAVRLDGGRDTLRQMLIEKLRTQHAGEVRTINPASLMTRWGKVQGLALRDKEETLGLSGLVVASPIVEFGDLFGERRPKRIAALEKAIRPTAYRYTLNLVIAEAGIPEGISPMTFVAVDPAKPLIGDNAFALYVGEPDDDANVVVTVTANAPAPGDGENLDDILAALRPRLLARVGSIMPFSAEHTLLVHSPNQTRVDGGAEGEGLMGARTHAWPPEPLWTAEEYAMGIGALPYDLGIRGVTTACTQNLPGLGLEGELVAAWCAARAVCQAAGKKKDYLKDEVLLGS